MSLRPHIFDYGSSWPKKLVDQNFGLTLTPEELLAAPTSPFLSRLRPFWPENPNSALKSDKDKWQINVDVQHFAPDEITVKITDGCIVVEAKHEERKDEHGFISRQFTRRFKLPDKFDPDTVVSRLSSDGVLTVVAPKIGEVVGEKTVPITPTGPIRKD